MSHPEQMEFVRLCRKYVCAGEQSNVLEIGSYNVNQEGGGVRSAFKDASRYIGVDLTEGPNVDLVMSGHEVTFPDASFDVTVSCECFEHNPEWRATFLNMARMTKPDGVILISCGTTGRIEHGTKRTSPKASPGTQAVEWNYYRNLTENDFRRELPLDSLFSEYRFYTAWSSRDLYFWGIRKGGAGRQINYGAIELGIARCHEGRKAIMTPMGWSARVAARTILYPIAKLLPDRLFQHIAVPYTKACYKVLRLTGIAVEEQKRAN